ncbi:MAG: hypothetical protein RXR17_09195 [Sulfolobaceae archaeon]
MSDEKMAGVWFNKINLSAKVNIQYTIKGKSIRPFLSSFVVRLAINHGEEYKEIAITIFPSSKIKVSLLLLKQQI